ncbi:DnaB-like helicase C-terminal domain-containing protein [Aeromonas sp.]|uniref:replicative DNA helicase n=1 Tax=Aeromonas sp. TaxID=647 RepID=UPI002585EC8B|nr:DnaB-like helicase C-terminal domain-containing protein [Aeromonas sp.]MCX7132295.1 AAA family ATPase [Aeromonas sp.]
MTNNTAGFIPPHNFEAEQSVLGGLMIRSSAYHDLSLSEPDFYSRPHQIVFGAISSLVSAKQPVDLMTVSNRIEVDGMLGDIGGMAYLIEIAKNTPSASNIEAYGAIVRQASERRFAVSKLYDCVAAMMDPGYTSCDDRFATMGSMLSEIDAKRSGGVSGIAAPASDIVIEWCDEMERRLTRKPGELAGFATGIPALDELLYPGGISQTALICIGARPKMGKTTLMAAMLNHTALRARLPVIGFSLEMTKRELFEVMVSQASSVSGQALKSMHDQSKMDQAYAVAAELGNSKLHLADQPGMGLHQIVRESRRLRRELGQLGVIAVDYLTLMKAEKAERNDLAYGAITKGLKELAKEMGCPVILLTQLNRGLESRADKRPMPSDSRDTGQIEQDCDIWIGCYRDEVYHEDSPTRGLMELLVRIHRGGRTGTAYCGFHEGVISTISQQEVASKVHMADMERSRDSKSKGGWDG